MGTLLWLPGGRVGLCVCVSVSRETAGPCSLCGRCKFNHTFLEHIFLSLILQTLFKGQSNGKILKEMFLMCRVEFTHSTDAYLTGMSINLKDYIFKIREMQRTGAMHLILIACVNAFCLMYSELSLVVENVQQFKVKLIVALNVYCKGLSVLH